MNGFLDRRAGEGVNECDGWMGGLIDGRMNGFHTGGWTWLNNVKFCGI